MQWVGMILITDQGNIDIKVSSAIEMVYEMLHDIMVVQELIHLFQSNLWISHYQASAIKQIQT